MIKIKDKSLTTLSSAIMTILLQKINIESAHYTSKVSFTKKIDYNWDKTFTDNVATFSVKGIDAAVVKEGKSNCSYDFTIQFIEEDNEISRIKLIVDDINYSYSKDNKFNVRNNVATITRQFFSVLYIILEAKEFSNIDNKDDIVTLSNEVEGSVEFSDNINLSIAYISISDCDSVSYSIVDKKNNIVNLITDINENLGGKLNDIMSQQGQKVSNLRRLRVDYQPVKFDDIYKDFKNTIDITSGEGYSTTFVLEGMERCQKATLIDLLILHDRTFIELNKIEYYKTINLKDLSKN